MIVHLERISKYFADNWHKHVFTSYNQHFLITSKRLLKEGCDYEIDLSKVTDLSTIDSFIPKGVFFEIDDIRTIATKIKKSFIEFKEVTTKKKTKTFEVFSKTDGSKLAEIKWYPNYRSYALFVTSEWANGFIDTKIFDPKCQREILEFTEKLMEEHKNDTNKAVIHTSKIQKQ